MNEKSLTDTNNTDNEKHEISKNLNKIVGYNLTALILSSDEFIMNCQTNQKFLYNSLPMFKSRNGIVDS